MSTGELSPHGGVAVASAFGNHGGGFVGGVGSSSGRHGADDETRQPQRQQMQQQLQQLQHQLRQQRYDPLEALNTSADDDDEEEEEEDEGEERGARAPSDSILEIRKMRPMGRYRHSADPYHPQGQPHAKVSRNDLALLGSDNERTCHHQARHEFSCEHVLNAPTHAHSLLPRCRLPLSLPSWFARSSDWHDRRRKIQCRAPSWTRPLSMV